MSARREHEGGGERRLRLTIALAMAVLVAVVTIGAQAPVGAGVYYDDGAYLALARALEGGDGYVYSNLPEAVPGVKYPPAYPAVLALVWKVAGSYPENLSALKALNAVLVALAAAFTFLLFARGGRRRIVVVALVTTGGYLAIPTLSLSTVLMSEPLFLVSGLLALLAVGRALREAAGELEDGYRRRPEHAMRARGARDWLRGEYGVAVAAGLLASLAFLTRAAGVTVIVAVLAGFLLRRRVRSALLAGAAALIPSTAWIAWSGSRAGEVPDPLVGQYGGYGDWLTAGAGTGGSLETGALGRLGEIAAANWSPLVDSLKFVWVPGASGAAAAFVLLVLAAAGLMGLWSTWRRNPALAVFPVAYLALVFVWPYEPYRFYYAILPLLTVAVAEGLFEAVPRIRPDIPRWSVPVGVIAAAILVVNTLQYQARGHLNRSWTMQQTIAAAAYEPLNEWIRTNTRPDEVIGSGLDPYIHWQTGRPAVPSWEFLANDYGRYDHAPEVLAAQLDSILVRFRPGFVALILGENKAAATLEAFAELHPDRAEKVFEAGEPHVGVIYRVVPPGQQIGLEPDGQTVGASRPTPASPP